MLDKTFLFKRKKFTRRNFSKNQVFIKGIADVTETIKPLVMVNYEILAAFKNKMCNFDMKKYRKNLKNVFCGEMPHPENSEFKKCRY